LNQIRNNIKLILAVTIYFFLNGICFSQPQTQWVQRFNSLGNNDDYVTDMAIDKSGNVYLTGYESVNGTDQNYVTIKYNTQGIEQWVRYYDGPDHREDKPVAIAVDDSGNVIVSGSSYSYNSSYDYLTIKYNSFGDLIWTRSYTNGLVANAMALDRKGNIYVTGIKFGTNSEDVLTIKYNRQGNLMWVREYNGTGDGFDISLSVNIDIASNIYVAGQSTENRGVLPRGIIIKYNENGDPQWVTYSPDTFVIFSAIADEMLHVYSVGHSEPNNNTDIATLKFDSTGSLIWERKYNRADSVPDQDDFYGGFTIDNEGNPIFTCVNSDNVLRWDVATVKYNSNGDFLWAKIFGVSSSNDESKFIATDKFKDIYVCGFKDDGLFPKYLIIKYSSTGEFRWFTTYNNNLPFGIHKAYKILIDTLENIYVTGVSQGTGTGTDFATIKYSQLTKITYENEIIRNQYKLLQNYPNPFNSQTIISFDITSKSFVTIKIFDPLGREISMLVNDYYNEGNYKVSFDANRISSGIYFYSLIVDGITIGTKKLILLK